MVVDFYVTFSKAHGIYPSCISSIILPSLGKKQIKIILIFHLLPLKMAKIKVINDDKCGMWLKGNTYSLLVEVYIVLPLWTSVWWFHKNLEPDLPHDPTITILGI